jgi:hypothetical protein
MHILVKMLTKSKDDQESDKVFKHKHPEPIPFSCPASGIKQFSFLGILPLEYAGGHKNIHLADCFYMKIG